MMASLSQLFFAKPATVPPEYQACQDFDKKLKAITKCKKGKYLPDESCPEEIDKQRQMLDATAISMKLKFGEVDMCERIRYCYECRHFKPDRSRHCSSCGFCVLKFDHHCPYVNACINFGNYKYFLNYIFYGSCFWLLAIIGEVYAVLIFFVNLDSTKQDGFANITQLFFALSIQFIPGKRVLLDLLQYHMSLVNCNETTCEQGKPPIFKGNNSTATYNTSVHQNRMSALGWGLWMFPVKTELLDGLHYPIFYTDASPGPKMVLRPTFKGGIRSDEL
uniref:Palmitoyltransferase n=1 Tax=Rhabditophanes sp. KR3021 TaxID=114890 RepID=A0AC35UBV7_9BILA